MSEDKGRDEVVMPGCPIKIHLPPGLPQLTPEGWRILLEILIELSVERGFKLHPASAVRGHMALIAERNLQVAGLRSADSGSGSPIV
jgi:hypothetical protein